MEDKYGIAGLFTPWQQHIQIDVDQGHAGGLGNLLESDREVSARELAIALRHAWLAFRFLRGGLDDIAVAGKIDSLSLRPPWPVPEHENHLLGLVDAYLNAHRSTEVIPADLASVQKSLAASAFRALGNARQHDEIIACGRWAQRLAQMPKSKHHTTPTIWSLAIKNHLQEAAQRPLNWLLLTKLLSARLPQFRLNDTWTVALDQLFRTHRASESDATSLFQLDELIERCTQCYEYVPNNLLHAFDE